MDTEQTDNVMLSSEMCYEENRSEGRLLFQQRLSEQTSEEVMFGQDLKDKEPACKHLGKDIPESTANAKALRQECFRKCKVASVARGP